MEGRRGCGGVAAGQPYGIVNDLTGGKADAPQVEFHARATQAYVPLGRELFRNRPFTSWEITTWLLEVFTTTRKYKVVLGTANQLNCTGFDTVAPFPGLNKLGGASGQVRFRVNNLNCERAPKPQPVLCATTAQR